MYQDPPGSSIDPSLMQDIYEFSVTVITVPVKDFFLKNLNLQNKSTFNIKAHQVFMNW